MTREELRDYVDEQRTLNNIPYHVYSALIDGIDTLEQESCDDTISRQAVLDYIYNDLGLGNEENGKDVERQTELEDSYRYVKSLSPVNPQPKTGHWIKENSVLRCNICDGGVERYNKYPYCPNCGAKMIEPQESEE